jgi:chemotaxis protein MotB
MMNRHFFSLIVVLAFSCSISGCLVTQSTYLKKAGELDNRTKELASLQQKYTDENNALKDKVTSLTADRDQLKEAFANATREREELEKVLQSKSDTLARNIVELRKKNAEIGVENQILTENLIHLKQLKEEELQSVKKTQDELLQKMRDEVAKGQINITELKGKLTVDVLEKILFDSGESEVKSEGLAVLQRLLDVLKHIQGKSIRVEGHTDNVKIKGPLSKKYPTNWELSAARAINVTRFLQKQGIDPASLSAASFGEYKPVADNSTSEGRAKNRRITIILLPKE